MMRMWNVYVIQSEVYNRRYTGMTQDVEKRVAEHNDGKTKSTKGFRPWKLIYQEEVGERAEARKRELYLKSGIGRELLDKMDL